MALRFYNTASRKKEGFISLDPGKARMYSCGPTVYNYAHIGNFRAYMVADLLRRHLLYRGFGLRHIMNITDVDDKTIKGSREANLSLGEFTEKYTKAFFEDLAALNIQKADIYPRATKHVDLMIGLVKTLLDKGYAYRGNDGIYFDISKFKDYGLFAHLDMKGLKAGARVNQDSYDKETASDFALWKFWTKQDGDVFWEAPFGKGRPGWHIECSAMSSAYLGQTFDIHTGGVDLIFPHHQNEIAQSEAANGVKFVRYWLHNEHLLVNGQKMSKSLGNFYTLRDLLAKGYDPMAIRYVLLSTHYRQKLDFSEDAIKNASSTLKRIRDFMAELKAVKGGGVSSGIGKTAAAAKKKFGEAMDDDLNISAALAAVFDMITVVNKAISKKEIGGKSSGEVYDLMLEFDRVLGLGLEKAAVATEEVQSRDGAYVMLLQGIKDLPKDVAELIEKRDAARKRKDWKAADELRNEVKKKGYIIEDTENGVKVKKAD
jgi:cysteinyl-tRNA synthetase